MTRVYAGQRCCNSFGSHPVHVWNIRGFPQKALSCHTFLPDLTSPNTHTHTLIDVGVQKVNEKKIRWRIKGILLQIGPFKNITPDQNLSPLVWVRRVKCLVFLFSALEIVAPSSQIFQHLSQHYFHTYCWWFRNPKANHLGCIKPCKQRNQLSNLNCWVYRVSEPSTASTTQDRNMNRVDQIAIIS